MQKEVKDAYRNETTKRAYTRQQSRVNNIRHQLVHKRIGALETRLAPPDVVAQRERRPRVLDEGRRESDVHDPGDLLELEGGRVGVGEGADGEAEAESDESEDCLRKVEALGISQKEWVGKMKRRTGTMVTSQLRPLTVDILV